MNKEEGKSGVICNNKKNVKKVRYTLLNGSPWCTKRKYMRRCWCTLDIFLGIEHRMKREEMEEQLNKKSSKDGGVPLTRQGSPTSTGSEDCKHTSRGVFVAIDSILGHIFLRE